MSVLYFAYGSNMSRERLASRLHGAELLGLAWLENHQLVCNKPGLDGSGKANVVVAASARVYGVLYRLELEHWSVLDRAEGGYQRLTREVDRGEWRDDGEIARLERLPAQLYVWPGKGPRLAPEGWYLDYLLEGAREHRLPEDYIRRIESLGGSA